MFETLSVMLGDLVPAYRYCESAGGFMPQPLNFLSCAVFWFGAVWMWHSRAADDESPSFHEVAAVLLSLMGLAGMAWHFSGHPLALAIDMLLLFLLFIIVAVVAANDVLRWSLAKGMAVIVVLVALSALLNDKSEVLLPQNGGLFLPLLFFLALAALKIQPHSEDATVYLLSAAYTLFFGLAARSADSLLCGYFPQGLHFLWHILLVIAVIYVGKTIAAMRTVPWPSADTPPAIPPDDKDAPPPANDVIYH